MLENIEILPGNPSPLGLSFQGDAAHFAVFSSHATSVFLGLFAENDPNPQKEIPLHKTGDIWHIAVKGLSAEGMTYAFRCEGPYDEKKGLLYKSNIWLVDPYAKKLSGQTRARVSPLEKFDWEGTLPPKIASQNLIIYEMHVRGFTQHSASAAAHPGTYLGIIEKIPYLKALGVNAVELLPIFEFDETHCLNVHPKTKKPLTNYWGYHPLHYFAAKRGYAASDPINEFKTLVRELHKNGIEIILDVVFNHTGEEQGLDYYINFRGLDNAVYYHIDKEGHYLNFSGCGNTVNCNHPAVQQLILDSLRYWVEEMHVDGFRFDLAAVFMRDPLGNLIPEPPILKAMASDPVISKVKLIAEPWDAAGLVQQGAFPKHGPWAEWNGYYRDTLRRFIKGTDNQAPLFAQILSGSKEIYQESTTPLSSINYISSHDGFCLRDLVTYNQKHNEENGEENRDGLEQNESWNCGAEGPTDNKDIIALRERQMRNFLLALFVSQGTPMLLMGDEYGHTRSGNNNPYTQDNALNWFLWDALEKNKNIFEYVSALIEFRQKNPSLQRTHFLTSNDIEWHGATPFKPDWSNLSRFVAFQTKHKRPFYHPFKTMDKGLLYIAFNASPQPLKVTLPPKTEWRQVVNTAKDWNQHHLRDPDKGEPISSPIELLGYSALLACS